MAENRLVSAVRVIQIVQFVGCKTKQQLKMLKYFIELTGNAESGDTLFKNVLESFLLSPVTKAEDCLTHRLLNNVGLTTNLQS